MPRIGTLHLVEHEDRLARVFQRDVGGRGHHDGAGDGGGLDQRELHIAGAGRQIDHQVIEFAPIHAAQKLLDDAVQHGSAPHQRLVAGIEEAHGHQLDAELLERLDALAISHGGAVDSHHEGHVGAVDVGVHQAGLVPSEARRHGQVHRNRGLADAALSGTDGNQVLHAGNRDFGHLARLIGSHWFHGSSRGRRGCRVGQALSPVKPSEARAPLDSREVRIGRRRQWRVGYGLGTEICGSRWAPMVRPLREEC